MTNLLGILENAQQSDELNALQTLNIRPSSGNIDITHILTLSTENKTHVECFASHLVVLSELRHSESRG